MVFEEFIVPDLPVAAALALVTLTVTGLLYAVRPAVSQGTVVAFVPWVVSGAVLHVLYQMGVALGERVVPGVPAAVLSAPSVYLTAFVLMGLYWVGATVVAPERVVGLLGLGGTATATLTVGYAVWVGADRFALDPVLPVLGLLGSLALATLLYLVVRLWRPSAVARARYVGGLVLFAHVFDAITTAVGVELLDATERSTFPRLILDIAADLPTADLLGEAWLFVVVKMAIATAIVVLLSSYPENQPTEGNLFFAFIAAIGLGPAVHNFFLFALGV
ncbi:MAG: putative membrane protein [halophilic archaeon J07HX64]|jgi:Predicted membrane protein|nr:MAG: putative membrane protein [halophilic archaeon J07HX64]